MLHPLVITVFLPLAGAVAVWVAAEGGKVPVRRITLCCTLATLLLAGWQAWRFPLGQEGVDLPWLTGPGAGFDVRFSLGLDGLSVWLFALTAVLMLTCVLVSWEAVTEQPHIFYGLLLLLESGLLGVFAARDVILFYVFFEFTLLPLFFLIGIWGSEERRRAANKFFLYTLAGSVITFLGLLAIVLWMFGRSGELTFSIPRLVELASDPRFQLDTAWQVWVFLALFVGFAIKVPLFPLHTWLPLAHTEAPTAGSVVLAGVLLKIGTYGFARFCLPILPDATAKLMPYLLWLSVAGIVYGALVALAQRDMKRLIAYSSVSHLGYCMLGLFALNRLGMHGGLLQMINHGLSTGGLFALVGMMYERYHTREIAQLGGVAQRLPRLAALVVFFTLASIGLPGLNGFVGEFLVLLGMFRRAFESPPAAWAWQWQVISVAAVGGVVLGAWYMLWLVQRVFFGQLREPHTKGRVPSHPSIIPSAAGPRRENEPSLASAGTAQDRGGHVSLPHAVSAPPDAAQQDGSHFAPADLSLRELLALAPLVVLILWIGLVPQRFIAPAQATLDQLIGRPAARLAEIWQKDAHRPSVAAGHPNEYRSTNRSVAAGSTQNPSGENIGAAGRGAPHSSVALGEVDVHVE